MPHIVYKIVRPIAKNTNGEILFKSFAAIGSNEKCYEKGKMLYSKTPLFVFQTEEKAVEVIRGSTQRYCVVKGTAIDEPVNPFDVCQYILPIHLYPYSVGEIKQFWHDWKTHPIELLRQKYPHLMQIPDGTFFVYDFTPLEMVYVNE